MGVRLWVQVVTDCHHLCYVWIFCHCQCPLCSSHVYLFTSTHVFGLPVLQTYPPLKHRISVQVQQPGQMKYCKQGWKCIYSCLFVHCVEKEGGTWAPRCVFFFFLFFFWGPLAAPLSRPGAPGGKLLRLCQWPGLTDTVEGDSNASLLEECPFT